MNTSSRTPAQPRGTSVPGTGTGEPGPAGNRQAVNDLTEAVLLIEHHVSTRPDRDHWRNNLLDFLPDPLERGAPRSETDAEEFLTLCEHLVEHTHSDTDLQELILGLIEVQQELCWHDQLLASVDHLTETIIERLYASLAPRFAASTDRGRAEKLYERLRDHCFGCDYRIIDAAAASPHITGRRIVLDFDESVLEHAPAPLVKKLENEGEHGFLLSLLGCGTVEPAVFLSHLTDPDHIVELGITRAVENDCELPYWLWASGVLDGRFELLRRTIPWYEIDENADRALWARIEDHLDEHLGNDPVHRETFHALEKDFPGTLDELIDAARLL